MGRLSDLLLGGIGQPDDDATLQPVQAPWLQPAPGQQPGPIDQDALRGGAPRRAVRSPAALEPAPMDQPHDPDVSPAGRFSRPVAPTPPATSFSDRLLGGGPTAPAPAPRDKALDLARGLNSGSLFGKVRDAVSGKQDPAYAGLKSFDEEMQAEKNDAAIRQLRIAAITMPSDAAYGDIMKDALGARFVRKETDQNGHDVMVYKGPDGSERKAYVNKPGLDTEDVSRGIVGALPFAATGGLTGSAMRGTGWALRALGQFGAGAATSAATDLGSMALGSEQGVDPGKAAVVGGLGAAGELAAPAIGALWQKFVTVPGLFNKATGTLTPKGEEAAKALGLDPAAMSDRIAKEFAKTYAKSPNAAEAEANVATRMFGIPSTVGQRTKNPQQLLKEEGMRYGIYGDAAQATMKALDEQQKAAIKDAVIGSVQPIPTKSPTMIAEQVKPGIATSLSPGRSPGNLDTASLGESIREGMGAAKQGARAAEREAWEGATDLLPKPEAMALLPDSIAGRIGSLRIDDRITPKAYSMAEDLQKYVDGKAMTEGGPAILKQTPVRTVDEMRRRLLTTYKGTVDPQDKAAAKAIYDGFNDWIGTAAEQQLLLGKPEAAAALRTARGLTAEIRDLFSPRDSTGAQTAGAKILREVIEKADSPERIVSALFFNTPQPSQIKAGSIEALQRMKTILDRYGDKSAAQSSWNDIRAAYWMRLVQDKRGDMFTPGNMLGNIKTALSSQRSVVGTLYTREEIANIRNFAKALETITYKDPNPSKSSFGVAAFAKEMLSHLFSAVGLNSKPAQIAIQAGAKFTGLAGTPGAVAAKQATSQGINSVRPNIGGLTGGAGSIYNQNSD